MKYNFKDEERLQIADFFNNDCLVADILNSIKQLRVEEVLEIYAKPELAEYIFKSIIRCDTSDNFKIGTIDFSGSEYDFDYGDPYCISINYLNEIWIEPAYSFSKKTNKLEILDSEATLAYVYQDDVKQDLIDMLDRNDTPTLLFGFETV